MKQTAQTAHGEVKYEVVECDSCGNDVAKEDAKRTAVGEYHGKDAWGHKPYDELKFGNYALGYACGYCADNPVKWPTKTFGDIETAFAAGFIASTLLFIVLLAV